MLEELVEMSVWNVNLGPFPTKNEWNNIAVFNSYRRKKLPFHNVAERSRYRVSRQYSFPILHQPSQRAVLQSKPLVNGAFHIGMRNTHRAYSTTPRPTVTASPPSTGSRKIALAVMCFIRLSNLFVRLQCFVCYKWRSMLTCRRQALFMGWGVSLSVFRYCNEWEKSPPSVFAISHPVDVAVFHVVNSNELTAKLWRALEISTPDIS